MSPGIAIPIMTQLLSFLFTTAISGFLAFISLSHWIVTPTKSSLLHFQRHILEHVHTIFQFFSGYIFYTISNELFLQHYHASSCTLFMPTFHVCSQYEISFHFFCQSHILQSGDWAVLSILCFT